MEQIPSFPTLPVEEVSLPVVQQICPKPGRPRKRETKQREKVEVKGAMIKSKSPRNGKLSPDTLIEKNSKSNLLEQ